MKMTFGSNADGAQSSFFDRQEYANNYPPGIRDYRKIDFWYNEMLFGRLSREGDIVYPAEGFLKQLENTNEGTYFVLNFVADAYKSFREDMIRQETQNHFIRLSGTPFQDRFEPTSAWVSVNSNFNVYVQDYYDSFLLPFVSDPDRLEDIENFDDFVTSFTRLIERTSLLIPFTKTEYIVSKYSSPLTSGLIVEFADNLHGEDQPKINDFINNINFELYREIASRNGFAVDMNAPWRLIADVGSVAMQQFMGFYGNDLNTMFDNYYYKSSFFDIPSLKSYMFSFYNSFVRSFPKMRSHIITTRSGKNISLTEVKDRAMLGHREFRSKYTNLFWIRLYLYIRAKETNRDWDQYKFDHVVKRASDFFTYSGERATIKFIDKEVKRAPGEYLQIEEYRRGSFRFKRKRE